MSFDLSRFKKKQALINEEPNQDTREREDWEPVI